MLKKFIQNLQKNWRPSPIGIDGYSYNSYVLYAGVMDMENRIIQFIGKTTYLAFLLLAALLFIAFALSSLHHIFLIPPALYFLYLSAKKGELRQQFCQSRAELFLLLLVITALISIVINIDMIKAPLKNILKLKYFIIPLLAIPALKYTFRTYITERKIKILANTFLISITVATVAGMIGMKTGFNPLKWATVKTARNAGMYGMVMSYAYGLSMILPAMLATIVALRNKNNRYLTNYVSEKLLWGATIVNLLGLYFSYTRGAMLGMIAALPFVFFFARRKIFWAMMAMAGVVFSVIIVITFSGTNINYYRLNAAKSNFLRMSIYKVVVKMAEEKPLLGVGFRNVERQVKEFRNKYQMQDSKFVGHAHNNYLEFLGGTGIIGFTFFALFLFSWMQMLLVSNNIWPAQILLPFMISFLTSGLFQSTIIDGENTYLVMALFMLSLMRCSEKVRRTS
ncbi:MAG: hypothetical protein A2404_00990 [Bdellovibrionales bacterium RIFOXYC1_FULL_39_130]|nr:MAG: hypothetical protein A2404_00990 [Bdellovibrionales bacterium RIFOXYC1_FULL_39_130]